MFDFLMNLNGKVGPFGHFAGLLGSGIFGFIHSVMTPRYESRVGGGSSSSSSSSSDGSSSSSSSSSGSSSSSSSSSSSGSSSSSSTPEISLADVIGGDVLGNEQLTLGDVVGN